MVSKGLFLNVFMQVTRHTRPEGHFKVWATIVFFQDHCHLLLGLFQNFYVIWIFFFQNVLCYYCLVAFFVIVFLNSETLCIVMLYFENCFFSLCIQRFEAFLASWRFINIFLLFYYLLPFYLLFFTRYSAFFQKPLLNLSSFTNRTSLIGCLS